MPEPRAEKTPSTAAAQKVKALESVLHSQTFARADQLKNFLRFVCEMEMAGRGAELTEYLIGVEALGRPNSYSPGDDSAVRNRAFALRKKLHEYYEQEEPDAPLRIELLKGSYRPHFTEQSSSPSQVPAQASLVTVSPHSDALVPQPARLYGRKSLVAAFLSGAVMIALCAGLIWFFPGAKDGVMQDHSRIAPVLAEAWGPLIASQSETLVCIANPPGFSVHRIDSMQSDLPSVPGSEPAPDRLYDWFRAQYPLPANASLSLTLTTNGTYWGDTCGAMTAMKILQMGGALPSLVPEKMVKVPTLRRRNVILFGTPEYSPAVAHFLEKCPLTVNYLHAIVERAPEKPPTPLYMPKRDAGNRIIAVYGLVTVLPSEDADDGLQRTVIFSGINSGGTQAAAEFFASPDHLPDLQQRLRQEGHDQFPAAYQVVIRAETDGNILLSFGYESHRVISD